MRILILSTLLLFSVSATPAKENYIQYHKDILRCEQLFVAENNVPAALKEYRKVTTRYSKPFTKDCFVALQLACSTADKENATYFFKKSFEGGLDWLAISASTHITHFLQTDTVLYSKVEKMYADLHPKFLASLNSELRTAVIRMKTSDDSVKALRQGLRPGPEADKRKNDQLIVMNTNTMLMAELVKKNGFLGDALIGYMDYGFDNDEQQRQQFCFSLRSLADQLYFHHCCCYFMQQDELMQAMKAGTMLPAMYASIYEWAYKNLKGGNPEASLCNPVNNTQEKYYNICPVIRPWEQNKDTMLVNKCRAEIGLGSLQHETMKKEYEKKNNVKLFFGMFNLY